MLLVPGGTANGVKGHSVYEQSWRTTGKGLLMRLLKVGLVQLLLISALSLASASPTLAELPLPDIHVLSGDTYPTTGEGKIEVTSGVVAELETAIGEKLTAKSVTLKTELKELAALGPVTYTFTGVEEPRSKTLCKLPEPALPFDGILLFTGEFHVVYIKTEPLTAAMLMLFGEQLIECNSGKLKIKVKAPVIIKLEKVTAGTDVSEYGLVANCMAKGKQELREYFTDEGKLMKAILLANFGLGFEEACYRASKEMVVKSTKMIDFLF
jgi:hypothetical protein